MIKGSILVVAGVLSASMVCAAPAASDKPVNSKAGPVVLADKQMDTVVAAGIPLGIERAAQQVPALGNLLPIGPPVYPPGLLNLSPGDPCAPGDPCSVLVINQLFGQLPCSC